MGFVPTEAADDPYPHVGVTSDSLSLALLSPGALTAPALVFTHAAMHERVAALRDAGLPFAPRLPAALDPERHALLVAPEGTQLLLTGGP